MNGRSSCSLCWSVLGLHVLPVAGTGRLPPRLLVLTDISSLTAGVAEPDDGQSLIRLMLYTNEFDIEGLIATSNLGHGQKTRPDLIRQVVDAYEKVRPNLLLHDPRYPAAEVLRGGIKAGAGTCWPKVPVMESIGEGKDTEASDWIIQGVDRPDPRPVWVVIWGGSADLAQALWRVRRDRTPRGTQPLPIQAPCPRHRRSGLDGSVDQRAVPRTVHDHPATGISGDVPGRRCEPGLIGMGRDEHPRARSTRRPLPQLSGRRHLVWDAGSGAGDQGGRHAVVPLPGPQRVIRPCSSLARQLGRAFRGRGESTDRHPRPRPRHEGRPGPTDVLGVPLASGVPG